MPSIDVRPFHRRDREQLTALVNAHVEAVLPGVAVSVNAVLSQLEREPGETIVDPWAVDRATFVAVVRDAVVAAAASAAGSSATAPTGCGSRAPTA